MRFVSKVALFGLVSLAAVGSHAEVSSVLTPPAGVNGNIQFNKRNGFGADPSLTYSTGTKNLSVSTVTVGFAIVWPNGFIQTSPSSGLTGAGSIQVQDGSTPIVTSSTLNFTGSQFVITDSAGKALISIDPSFAGGGQLFPSTATPNFQYGLSASTISISGIIQGTGSSAMSISSGTISGTLTITTGTRAGLPYGASIQFRKDLELTDGKALVLDNQGMTGYLTLFNSAGVARLSGPLLTTSSITAGSFYGSGANLNFSASGVGTSSRTMESKFRDSESSFDYGAIGDGSTNDTTALQNALNTCKDIHIVGTTSYYKITTPLNINCNNQRIYGDGPRSRIVSAGPTSVTSSVFQVQNKSGIVFENLNVTPSTSSTSIFTGYGFYVDNSSAIVVRNNTGTEALRGFVHLFNSSYCVVEGNMIRDAYQRRNYGSFQISQYGSDIYLTGSSSYNRIVKNTISNSVGTGIALQSLVSSATVIGNIVDNNIISSCPTYGIVAYKYNFPEDTVRRNIISNNVIENVFGNIVDGGVFYYGTGIYIQGAEDSVVTGNSIYNTNFTTNTISDILAPGAIGVTNVVSGIFSNNRIEKTNGWDGILLRDPNLFGDTTGFATVNGNMIRSVRHGINVQDRGNAGIFGNVISSCSSVGILTGSEQNHRSFRGMSVTGNNIKLVASGIDIANSSGAVVSGNNISTATNYGIVIETGTNISVTGNVTINGETTGGSAGILCAVGVTSATINGNTITQNKFGLILNSSATVSNNNIYGNNTNYAGNVRYAGETLNALQPSFMYSITSQVANLIGAGGSAKTVTFANRIYDQTGAVTGSTFTAAVAGNYNFCTMINFRGLTSSVTQYEARIVTTGPAGTVRARVIPAASQTNQEDSLSFCTGPIPMRRNDTALVNVFADGATDVVDIYGDGSFTYSYFSGYLAN